MCLSVESCEVVVDLVVLVVKMKEHYFPNEIDIYLVLL